MLFSKLNRRDFDKSLQIVSCTATERQRLTKSKISLSITRIITPFPVTLLDASLQTGYYSI